jgi:hypothetical protein
MADEKGTINVSITWLGFGATVVAQIVAFAFFLAKIDAGLDAARADTSRLETNSVTHHTRIESAIAALQAENRILESQVQYLCNERRRDNQEAGRSENSNC